MPRLTKFAIPLSFDSIIVPFTFMFTLLIWWSEFVPTLDNVVNVGLVMAAAGGLSLLLFGFYHVKLNTYEQTGILQTGAYGITSGLAGNITSKKVFNAPL
ncbi:MAG: hypothetical protein ACSHW1_17065 [Yoonia sp.]|uniref:hypothetical protein n=1 Tax=Yoonia sp. TaxID=2212373 RepID=UPI003EF9981C